jgi:cell division septum initiation protein DivIVA
MDIQHLVDRLEDLIDEGRHLFGTKYTMIDEERALELIDQMRISIPEEIEKSRRILQQRERILSEAHEEAARIVQQHRLKAEQMIDHDSTVQAASARANEVIDQARREAARITAEADQYVLDMLKQLEQQLVRDLTEVRNGISVVLQPAAQPSPVAHQPVHIPMPVEAEKVQVGRNDYED